MDHPLYNTHVKLLASDLLSLTPIPSSSDLNSVSFSLNGALISRAKTVGTVTSLDLKPSDDGTACVGCILWLSHPSSRHFFHRCAPDVRLIAQLAADRFAPSVKLDPVVRVRGRITKYRGEVQITVPDVVVERYPNAEILHWLDCMRLARRCYDVLPRK